MALEASAGTAAAAAAAADPPPNPDLPLLIIDGCTRFLLRDDGEALHQGAGGVLVVTACRLQFLPSDGSTPWVLEWAGAARFWSGACEVGLASPGEPVILLRCDAAKPAVLARLGELLDLGPPPDDDDDDDGAEALPVASPAAPRSAQLAASLITSTGHAASFGLRTGASALGVGLDAALQGFKRNVRPREQELEVHPATEAVVDAGGSVARAALSFTGAVASVAAKAGSAALASASSSMGDGGAASSTPGMAALRTVGGASIAAVAELCSALEESTDIVASKAAEAASGAVEHRYGDEAGHVCSAGLGAVGSAYEAVGNVRGKKAIAKLAAKSALQGAAGSRPG